MATSVGLSRLDSAVLQINLQNASAGESSFHNLWAAHNHTTDGQEVHLKVLDAAYIVTETMRHKQGLGQAFHRKCSRENEPGDWQEPRSRLRKELFFQSSKNLCFPNSGLCQDRVCAFINPPLAQKPVC